MKKEHFVIGIIGAPFGLKGFVKVRSCSGEIDHLLKLESEIVNIVSKGGNESPLQLRIEEITLAPSIVSPAVMIRFTGIDSPEKAKTLSGAQILTGREQAAPLNDGEFYIEDLKGLTVTAENGDIIGCITDIIEGGGGELAEIKLSGGELKLVPFRKEFLSGICLKNNKAVLKNLWILE